MTLGPGGKPVAASQRDLLRRGSFNSWEVCGPARATCIRAIAQTIRVVADFGMVNYPPDAEFPLPLSPEAGGAQARVDYHLVPVA